MNCVRGYQVYPRSYQDTNGDGVGDLNGIERRLDYLVGLGINASGRSPISMIFSPRPIQKGSGF